MTTTYPPAPPTELPNPPAPKRRATPPPSRVGADLVAIIPGALVGILTLSWLVSLNLEGPGAGWTAVGQWTGLMTSAGALITVALLARVPVITRAIGPDTAIRWHRWAATATMVLLPIHIVTIVIGYAAAEGTDVSHEVWNLLTTYPDLITATVGSVLLAVVAISSIRRLRRRLRYFTWLFVHWYSYLAVALAFGHTLSDGASFMHQEWPSLAWTWLHLFVAGLVLWYRVAVPAWLMLTHPLHVSAIVPESPDAVSITLTGERLGDYAIEGGQHIRVRFLTRSGWWQSHPFSLSAAPTDAAWRFTVVAAGDHTTWMQGAPVGTRCLVSGAYGHLVASRRTSDRVALIGGGAGITPLLALLEELPPSVDATVLHRAHARDGVLHARELADLTARRGSTYRVVVGPRNPDAAHDALSPAGLRHFVPDIVDRDVYVVGLAGFVDRVRGSLRQLGVPDQRIHTERYDP